MNCPVCDATLRPVQKHAVEVDICPDCKGVWLDRGELDKIVDAVSGGYVPNPENTSQRRDARSRDEERSAQRPKKREGWFSEIFDGFGRD